MPGILRSAAICTAGFLLLTIAACHRDEISRPLIVILIPSQDNPFFRVRGDAAAARARSLGYRVRVDVS